MFDTLCPYIQKMTKQNLEEKCIWKEVIQSSQGVPHKDFHKCEGCNGYEKFCQDYNPLKNYKIQNDTKNNPKRIY